MCPITEGHTSKKYNHLKCKDDDDDNDDDNDDGRLFVD